MRFAFVSILGLSPIWVAVAIVVFMAMGDSETLVASPWLIVWAIPACAVSLPIALVTLAVYSGVSGDQSRKMKYATTVFVSALVAVGVGIAVYFAKQETLAQDLKREPDLVAEFIRKQEAVRLVVGDIGKVTFESYTTSPGTAPVRYFFQVDGSKTAFAVVKVDRSGSAPTFIFLCTTDLAPGQRDPVKDVCKQ
jgi:hypothetical protein